MVDQRSEFRLALPNHDRAPGLARHELCRFAERAELDERELGAVALLVSELVTNAVRHGRADPAAVIGLHVQSSGDRIRIEVRDRGVGFEPGQRRPEPRNEGGYGLLIVAKLCAEWGVESDGEATVWCEFAREAVATG